MLLLRVLDGSGRVDEGLGGLGRVWEGLGGFWGGWFLMHLGLLRPLLHLLLLLLLLPGAAGNPHRA